MASIVILIGALLLTMVLVWSTVRAAFAAFQAESPATVAAGEVQRQLGGQGWPRMQKLVQKRKLLVWEGTTKRGSAEASPAGLTDRRRGVLWIMRVIGFSWEGV